EAMGQRPAALLGVLSITAQSGAPAAVLKVVDEAGGGGTVRRLARGGEIRERFLQLAFAHTDFPAAAAIGRMNPQIEPPLLLALGQPDRKLARLGAAGRGAGDIVHGPFPFRSIRVHDLEVRL